MNTKDILQGIKDWAAPKVIFDISAAHNNTKYTDLSNALGTNGDNIPQEYRKGGITVRYVQSSDNKYVQFRLMAQSFTTDVTQWQGVDEKPTTKSDNLIKSGGAYSSICSIDQKVGHPAINETLDVSSAEDIVYNGTSFDAGGGNFKTFVVHLIKGDKFTLNSTTGTTLSYKVFDTEPAIGKIASQISGYGTGEYVATHDDEYMCLQFRYGGSYASPSVNYSIKALGVYIDFEEVCTEFDDINNKLIYSEALAGLVFNTTAPHIQAKSAIKKIWIDYASWLDESEREIAAVLYETVKNVQLYITDLSNVETQYGCFFAIRASSGDSNTTASYYKAGIVRSTETWNIAVKSGSPLWPANSGLTKSPFVINVTIDWNSISGETILTNGIDPIPLTVGNLNFGGPKEDVTLKEQVKRNSETLDLERYNGIQGKNIVFFGDSLTEMTDPNNRHFTNYLAEYTGANCINVGVGGTMICQRIAKKTTVFNPEVTYQQNDMVFYKASGETEYGWYRFDSAHIGAWTGTDVTELSMNSWTYAGLDIVNMVKSACTQDFDDAIAAAEYIRDNGSDDNTAIVQRLSNINWASVHAVCIFGGTNDWYNPNTLGNPGDQRIYTTLGAIDEIIRTLMSTYPNVKLFWFTPIVRWLDYVNKTPESFSDVYNVEGNGTLKQESQAIENEVVGFHVPVCDLYNKLGWNMYNFSNYFSGTDGTHPSTINGVTFLAKKFTSFLLSHNTL